MSQQKDQKSDRPLRSTERRHPETGALDQCSLPSFVDLMIDENRTAVEAVSSVRKELVTVIEWTADAFRSGGRLFYAGAGTSGRLGVLDASECPPTFSTDPEQVQGLIAGGHEALVRSRESREDQPEAGRAVVRERNVSGDDVLIGLSASGRTPFVQGTLLEANRRGARTAAVICVKPEKCTFNADLFLSAVTGPEILAGSTRLKAGTATKVILNTISTGAMIRIGKTYENLMVDLQVNSEKLQERGLRILRDVTGLDREPARETLRAAEGDVKVAIVMELEQIDRKQAEHRLREANGHLRTVIQGTGRCKNNEG